MTEDQPFQLPFPPIVEVIVDIDCELPPAVKISDLEAVAQASLKESYPRLEKRMLQQFQIRKQGEDPPAHSIKEGLDALLFRSEDGKQLTQFRRLGYSFNRLAPYEGMDTYLPEIQRTWENYRGIAKPLLIRKIGLRTINRIQLPLNPRKISADWSPNSKSRRPQLHFHRFPQPASDSGPGNRAAGQHRSGNEGGARRQTYHYSGY